MNEEFTRDRIFSKVGNKHMHMASLW